MGGLQQQVGGTKVSYTTMPIGNVTVHAQWTVNQYTITFNGNGGSTPSAIRANYGAAISMPTSTKAPYTFAGWYTAASGGSQVNYTTMPLNGGTVYAQWKLTVGTEVTLGGEKFFVIEDSPAGNSNVKLISKFNLNTAGSAQQNAAYATTACVFSSSKYWSGNSENLNTNSAPAGSAYQKAKAYGAAKGGTGRLMTYDEANVLKSKNTKVLYGTGIGATDNHLRYWLGTSYSANGASGIVWRVFGDFGNIGMYGFGGMIFSSSDYGVRPVIEVSKTKVT